MSPITNFGNAESHCLFGVIGIVKEPNRPLLMFISMLVAMLVTVVIVMLVTVVIVMLVAMVIFLVH